MHPELAVSERSAQGDGIAINSRVRILESRLDMTKRARKTLNYEIRNVQNDVTLHHLTYLEVIFIFFTEVYFWGLPERTR